MAPVDCKAWLPPNLYIAGTTAMPLPMPDISQADTLPPFVFSTPILPTPHPASFPPKLGAWVKRLEHAPSSLLSSKMPRSLSLSASLTGLRNDSGRGSVTSVLGNLTSLRDHAKEPRGFSQRERALFLNDDQTVKFHHSLEVTICFLYNAASPCFWTLFWPYIWDASMNICPSCSWGGPAREGNARVVLSSEQVLCRLHALWWESPSRRKRPRGPPPLSASSWKAKASTERQELETLPQILRSSGHFSRPRPFHCFFGWKKRMLLACLPKQCWHPWDGSRHAQG